jgi:hypothetical protein
VAGNHDRDIVMIIVKEDCGGTTGVQESGCEYRMYCPSKGKNLINL